jgi:hypothetical protein
MQTFDQLEKFTAELELVKSQHALQEFKSLWRIMKAIQLKYIPDLPSDYAVKQDAMLARLDIKDVEPTEYTTEQTIQIMEGFYSTCTIDPDLL